MRESRKIQENNFFETLWFKFFPYWPLLILLSLVCLSLAVFYVLNEKPEYNVTATIVIDEEEETLNNNQPFNSLNPYASNPVVDNEVLVLQSRNLMNRVVNRLHLYAPLYEKGTFTLASAYSSSPIIIEAKDPGTLKETKKEEFKLDPTGHQVKIGSIYYPFNQWVQLPFGTVRFLRNPHRTKRTSQIFYFSIVKPAKVATALLKKLDVATVTKLSTAINLTFTTDDAVKGEDILNALLREYQQSAVANENVQAASTLTFVNERLSEVERDLDSIERKIQQFRTSGGIIDLTEQGKIYLNTIAENDKRILEINTQLAVLDQVRQYINAQGRRTGIIPTALGIDDPVLARLLQELNDLELQLANAKTKVGENNVKVRSIENEIQKVRPSIINIVTNQQARLRASRNNISSATARIGASVQNIPQQERELMEISRQQAVKRELYAFLLQRREEAALGNASAIAAHRIVDWADATAALPSSKKIIVILAAFVLGCALCFVYIFYRENLNSRILFRSQLESQTSYPVAGEINYRKHRTPILVQPEYKTAVSEQFRQLQASLNLFDRKSRCQKILVTSAIANEGKSFTCLNLASSLAIAGKRVVVVDLNLLDPDIDTRLQVNSNDGLIGFLQGTKDARDLIRQSSINNLDVVPAGTKTINSLALLKHERLQVLFQALEQQYEFILIDTPPVELATDAYLLSQYADITLFVVRHNVTAVSIVKQLDENPRIAQMQNLHLVFNGIKGRGFLKKYYGYGYGYGNEHVLKDRAYNFSSP